MKKPRIHREGRTLICGTALLLFLVNVPMYLYFPHWIFGITLSLTALLLVFVTYFFRNPVRVLEIDDPNFIIAPADGRVVVVEPMEENEYFLLKGLSEKPGSVIMNGMELPEQPEQHGLYFEPSWYMAADGTLLIRGIHAHEIRLTIA